MERKTPFQQNEIYHIFSRGVEKRRIFMHDGDSDRFLLLLLACNSSKAVRLSDMPKISRGEPLRWLRERAGREERATDILAYALMPNHIHLVAREKAPGGISKFMLKLMTAYSMYFNTKYERSGPLFTRPFRSKHVDSDEYFRWLFAYVSFFN